MASLNKVVIVGTLTRDPELRHIPSGTAVCELGLAINEKRKQGDQWVEETTFIDVTLWARTAEVAAEFLAKGSSVLIEGKLRLDSWEKDGKKQSKLKVVGENMQMLGGKGQGGGQPQPSRGPAKARSKPAADEYSQPETAASAPVFDDNSIPF